MRTLIRYCLILTLIGTGISCTSEPARTTTTKSQETASPAAKGTPQTPKDTTMQEPKLPKGTYARFDTTQGIFTARLFTDKTPLTAQNFIDLVEGKKAHMDPGTGQMVATPMYDGRKIFRIMKGFMFQTGSANDTGAYNAGFSIQDEFHPDLGHSKPGILSMANAGPNTGSSQFFVTFAPRPSLNNKHAVFGEVVEGMDVVRKIEQTPVRRSAMSPEMSEPVDPPVIRKITILRIGETQPTPAP